MRSSLSIRIAAVLAMCLSVAVVTAQQSAPTEKAAQPADAAKAVPPAEKAAQPGTAQAAPPAATEKAPPKQDEPIARQASDAVVAAFNRGSAPGVAAMFMENGELIDDAGNVHKGRKAIEELLARFFERYPGAQLQQRIESSRLLGSWLAVQEGVDTIATKEGNEKSVNRFTAVLVHLESGWAYATVRQQPDEQEPTPHERLEPLAWMVGDWVDEGADDVMAISCRWSEDKNFLLIQYESKIREKGGLKSTQRIGWDPLTQRVRSWVFDADGGYGEGQWTLVDKAWMIKSTAVMPDGQTGSATLIIEPVGKDKFTMKGVDRILGDSAKPDFQVTVVRKPPQPAQ